jgi:hypothetical protein
MARFWYEWETSQGFTIILQWDGDNTTLTYESTDSLRKSRAKSKEKW